MIFIPKPAKLILTMTFSDVALKKIKPERKAELETELKNAVKTFQDSTKRIFILAAREEINALNNTIKDKTVQLIHDATSTFMIENGIEGCSVHDKAWNIMHHYGASLLFHHHKENDLLMLVQTLYCERYEILNPPEVIDLPNIRRTNFDDAGEFNAALATYNTNSNLPALQGHIKLKKILDDVLVIPFTRYTDKVEENKRHLNLQKQIVALRDGPATAATAMEIDQELPADRQTLKMLIDHAIHAKTAKLTKEIALLKKAAATTRPNNRETQNPRQRGRSTTGASNKKKSEDQSNQQQPTNRRRNNRSRSKSRNSSTGSRSNASGKGKQNRRNNNSNDRSNQKNRRSQTRRGRPKK